MTIYIEYAVFDNLVINAILLWFTFRTIKNRLSAWKVLLCALIGVAFAVLVPIAAMCLLALFRVQSHTIAMLVLMTLKVIITVLFLCALSVLIRVLNYRGKIENYLQSVTIEIKDKKFTARGFIDTGNQLTDPKSQKPVCVISHELYLKMFPITNGYYIDFKTVGKNGKMFVFGARVNEREVKLGVTNKTFANYDILLNANII
jgi:hypothetical protein